MARVRYFIGLALALALLLIIRFSLLRCGPFGADVPNFNDEGNYVNQARSLLAGDTIADTTLPWMRAPLAALLLAGLSLLRGVPPHLVVCDFQVVQIAIWAGLLLLLASLAATLFDRRTALVSAFLVALLPETALLAVLVYSETIFCAGLLVIAALLLAYRRRPRFWLLVLAGLAAGCAALSRSALLALLPVLLLWAGLARDNRQAEAQPRGRRWSLAFRGWRLYLLPGAALLVCCFLVIAPWTIRNYQTYGGLILIDTIGAYTLYADNAPQSRGASNAAMMAASLSPLGRQQFATSQAWAIIRADPVLMVRDWLPGSVGTWYPRSFATTRDVWADLLQQPLTASLLAQLNLLQALILLLLPLGLLCAPHSAPGARGYRAAMVGLALGYTAMTAVTHFEGRYRTPFLLLLLPYAAWCIAHPRLLLPTLRRPAAWVALAVAALLALAAWRAIWPAQWDNGRALALHVTGQLREAWGDSAGALADQRAAATLEPRLREARVAAARLLAEMGDRTEAERVLRAVLADVPGLFNDVPDAVTELQRLLLSQGDEAAAAALDRQLSVPARRRAEALAWQRGLPPSLALALGRNDLGLAQGFYSYETDGERTFRWSRPQARVVLAGAGNYVCLHINAARPPFVPAPVVTLWVVSDGQTVVLGDIAPPRSGWAWLCRPLPNRRGEQIELQLQTARYSPHLYGISLDTREMGVAIAEVQLRPGPLALDAATGLLLDRPARAQPENELELIGVSGDFEASPGAQLLLGLWWRGAQSPPVGIFSFVHLLDESGAQIASYNAPFAGQNYPQPWVAGEPLADQAILSLPTTLPAGSYRLVAGAFDPVSGAVLTRADVGEVRVQ